MRLFWYSVILISCVFVLGSDGGASRADAASVTNSNLAPVTELSVSSAAAGGIVNSIDPAAAGVATEGGLATMLLFAFLGGLILNIMPCVLPVISLKILGFVNQSASSPRRVRELGLVYALGVIVSLLAMGGGVIALKQAGKAVSWGIQFGNPQFIVLLMSLVTLVALNLFGVFEVTLGSGVTGSAGELAQKEGKVGAFFTVGCLK